MERQLVRNVDKINDDVIRAKRVIENRLLNDEDIITALHNEQIGYDRDRRSDYLNTNIFSYIRIPNTIDKVQSYICFQIDDIEETRFNEVMKIQYIQFVVMVHGDDIDTPWGMKRHDLLGYLIRDIFNWSNLFGMQLKLIYNRESIMDTNFSARTLKFEVTKPNALNKGIPANRFEQSKIYNDMISHTEDLLIE